MLQRFTNRVSNGYIRSWQKQSYSQSSYTHLKKSFSHIQYTHINTNKQYTQSFIRMCHSKNTKRDDIEEFRVGKVPPEVLQDIVFSRLGAKDTQGQVVVPPMMGEDAAVLQLNSIHKRDPTYQLSGTKEEKEDIELFGKRIMKVKKLGSRLTVTCDPVTAGPSVDMGRLIVHVNANDIAAAGGKPQWLLLTVLLPEGTPVSVLKEIMDQVNETANELGICIIGGHTEITSVVNAPVCVGTMLGELQTDNIVTTSGAEEGDHIILTKGAAIEGTAILCSNALRRDKLVKAHPRLFSEEELIKACKDYSEMLSVVKDARLTIRAGGMGLTGMHDPTEGGVANALYEMAAASGKGFQVKRREITVSDLTSRLCEAINVDPLHMISSGALLATVKPTHVERVLKELWQGGIVATDIGIIVSDEKITEIDDRENNDGEEKWIKMRRPVQDALWDVLKEFEE